MLVLIVAQTNGENFALHSETGKQVSFSLLF